MNTFHPRMKVCSLHFKPTDYVLPADSSAQRKILMKSAVPSINLPVTLKEKEISVKNEARLNRLIKRKVAVKSNNLTKSPTPQIESSAKHCVQDDNICEVEKESVVNEECNSVGENQLGVTARRGILDSEDPVLALIEKDKERKVLNYSFSDTLNTDEKVCTATGISTIKILDTIVNMVKSVHGNRFETCKVNTRDRVILTYMKMKHNTSYRLLALIFTCASSQVCQKIFLKTIEILSNILSVAIPWPSREEISQNLPTCFEGFEATRIVLDCTEINIQQSKNLCCQVKVYSHYKGGTTVKFLIGVSPAGIITFVSPAYGGKASDTVIFSQSKLINLLEPNDAIMIDRGFLID